MDGCNCTNRMGLQVVKMSQTVGQRYEVDEEALASVLLRDDVRHLPVMVVSVAGAYRSGKSFILDFFLRYLSAPRSSQLRKEWLGREDELLEGFDWRGGGEANTKGIHLWPEPIIVTVEQTGEKVAVLLMDTQGTFDTEIDMNENSTIFALSTLLSSVQIYNLRANIGEDDLQHLQLFTEYGRLVGGEEQKAFQTLNFLVRDWMSPYEHPYGYKGGQALLNMKLQTKKHCQKKQLQEVRQHIHSCFEKIQCFLMPHPGLAVADPNFRGRLCDITELFRFSLLELVPSLFDPDNLTPKIINGEKVQAQGLFEYFKQYVNIFNSDDLPEAFTIFQATVDACMMAALREARHHYESSMESNMIDGVSVSTNMVQSWHDDAVETALEHFRRKKKLGSQENVEKYLEDFKKELEARLSLFLEQNAIKLRNTLAIAKKAYEDAIASVCEVQARLCLNPKDLELLHKQALEQALQLFQQGRSRVPQEQDEEKPKLVADLGQLYDHLCAVNERNNKNANLEAREVYSSQMKVCMNEVGVSSNVLKTQHEKALSEAIKYFNSQRNRPTEKSEDPFMDRLQQDVATCYEEFQKANYNCNMGCFYVAQSTYNNHMSSVQSCCYHPQELQKLHEEGKALALQQFHKDRAGSENDEFKDQLIGILERRFAELKAINDSSNVQSVECAFTQYTLQMDAIRRDRRFRCILKFRGVPQEYHLSAKHQALSYFNSRRRGCTQNNDVYLNQLIWKIDSAFANIYGRRYRALPRRYVIS